MNLSLNVSLDKKTTLHKKSNFLLYTIEKGVSVLEELINLETWQWLLWSCAPWDS